MGNSKFKLQTPKQQRHEETRQLQRHNVTVDEDTEDTLDVADVADVADDPGA